MQIEMWPIDRLIPYDNNPRKNDHAVAAVAQAIDQFGFRVPVLIKGEGQVIDGHLRLKAAKHIGLQEVPILRADDMSEAQVRAFRISINKMAELAQWDLALLKKELEALKTMDFDLGLTGFAEVDLDDLLGIDSDSGKDNAIPPLQDKAISTLGDLWIMGEHRLLCGDSRSREDVTKLMADGMADMVFIDPPYNVDYEGKAGKIKNDKMKDDEFLAFLEQTFAAVTAIMHPGAGIYVAHADAGHLGLIFRQAFLKAGLKLASVLVWRKDNFVLGRADYHWQHEPILYGWRPGASHRWYGGRKKTTIQDFGSQTGAVTRIGEHHYQLQLGNEVFVISGHELQVEAVASTVIHEDKPLSSDLHPTMKPVALVERFVVNSSRVGEVVADTFGGSGTTLIACEKRKRKGRIMELDPRFVDVIVRRWQEYTGGQAIHEQSGQTFRQREAGPP